MWSAVQERIDDCRRCEVAGVPHLCVPTSLKRHPLFSPPAPTRIYFVSVAPPWGGAYFWDESRADAVREGLFTAVGLAVGEPLQTCSDFHQLGFHLSPAVKCPSERNGNDYHPAKRAVRNCQEHLRAELECAQAERILALGAVPFQSLSSLFSLDAPSRVEDYHGRIWWVGIGAREIPLSGTYFPGNDRHGGLHHIPADLRGLLDVVPRTRAA
jgi:uracil-DNA glycosylase